MNGSPPNPVDGDLKAALMRIDERLKRVESVLNLGPAAPELVEHRVEPREDPPETPAVPAFEPIKEQESLEFEVGQTWFALIGIVALAVGMLFVLTLPFATLPAWMPSLGGYAVTALIFIIARFSRDSFETIAKYLRGSGMLLLFLSSIRLMYFGEASFLEPASVAAGAILVITVGINLLLAWRRNSPTLWNLAALTGCAAALAVGTPWFVVVVLTTVAAGSAYAQVKRNWRNLTPSVFSLIMVSYVIWAIGNPVVGNSFGIIKSAYPVTFCIPLWITLFSYIVLTRPEREQEDSLTQGSAVIICGLGFMVYFLHHFLGHDSMLLVSHVFMAILLLTIALLFWIRENSRFSTFIYAMTGYMSLSMALLQGFDSPEVFVALSVQSLVVIATAIYFCSKFIILANSMIFIGIILGYIAVSDVEQGMSLGFGIVALISARILNWQKKRLTLETEFMRNTYLTVAFLVLPYALYYLAPDKFIAVAWLGLSLFYYGLFLFFGNRKYRWMGHMTLLLTALYVVLVGTSSLESNYRIITFFALGSIMVIVSLIFSLIRRKQTSASPPEESA